MLTPRRWTLAAAIAIALFGSACYKRSGGAEPLSADESAPAMMMEVPPPPAKALLRSPGMPGGGAMQGGENRNGSQLAYEHNVLVKLAAARVADNLARTREACTTQKFGACDLLGEKLEAGDYPAGQLQMRAVPAAIGPLVQLAADGGEVAQRSTTAEDLAEAVRDNGLRRKRLELQHAKLSEIMTRRDAKVEDLVALSDRLAQIEAELQTAEQEGAQQQRRIRTNLLTVDFHSDIVAVAAEEHTRIGEALRGLTTVWDTTVAGLITIVLGALLPFALVIGGLVWLVVAARRRRRARAAANS
jgi:hypothetical protein